jgi:hypothetical protein
MMHKLVILIESLDDWEIVDALWPQFLHQVESLPNLKREATSRVEKFLFGRVSIAKVHELFFDSLAEAEQALTSPAGQEAGKLIQRMTRGRVILFFAEHLEDTLENIQQSRQVNGQGK